MGFRKNGVNIVNGRTYRARVAQRTGFFVHDSANGAATIAGEPIQQIGINVRALDSYVPRGLKDLRTPQTDLPRIAKDKNLVRQIEHSLKSVPSSHWLCRGDARDLSFIPDNSIHLVLTSPPYWTLKDYRQSKGQMGHIADYNEFLKELDHVWRECFRVLVPGGRLICVVGDVCLSRRKNNGRHTVVPLHASIQEHCRETGFDNLAPIIWYKIANAAYEVDNGGAGFLGKPYEPNAVIKNDIEFVLMQRKPGGYRTPSMPARTLSLISAENYQRWFKQIWEGITGASTREHPAPYPVELAARLVRMFSFAGDTVLDPFAGTGTTMIAAAQFGRNSIGVEVDPEYAALAEERFQKSLLDLFSRSELRVRK